MTEYLKGKMPVIYIVKTASYDRLSGIIAPKTTLCILINDLFVDLFDYTPYRVFEETKSEEVICETQYVIQDLGFSIVNPDCYYLLESFFEKQGLSKTNFFKKLL